MNWTPDLVSYAEGLKEAGHTHGKIARCVSNRAGESVTPKAVERMFAKRRRGEIAIPIYWEGSTEETTQVEVPRPAQCANDNGLETILFIPDTHVPFEDKRAFSLVVQIGRWLRPGHLVVLGDFGDFFSVSAHDRNPERARSIRFVDEVAAINRRLDELDSIGARRKLFVEGNHEFRLARHLTKCAPELMGLPGLTVPELFKLDQRGWSFTPYMRDVQIGKLFLTHEKGKAGAQAHVDARNKYQSNAAIGHTHRMALHYQGNAKGESHVGAMFGWLGDVETVDWTHRVQAAEWQLGFGIGHMEPDGVVHVAGVPIINHRCVVNGRLFSADSVAA